MSIGGVYSNNLELINYLEITKALISNGHISMSSVVTSVLFLSSVMRAEYN